ncbi:MAG: DMT family transporter [Promethearchaeota archaeon]
MNKITKLRKQTYLLIFLSIIIFGTVFPFSKQLIPPLNSFTYLFLRNLFGTVFLLLVITLNKNLKKSFLEIKSELKDLLIISAAFHLVPLIFIFIATPLTSSTNQVIINNLNLTFVVAINLFFFKIKPTKKLLAAVGLNFVGLLLVIWPLDFSKNGTLAGDLITILAVFIGAFFPAWNKKLANKVSPISVSLILNLFSTVTLLPLMGLFGLGEAIEMMFPIHWFYIIWVGIGISGIGYWAVAAAYTSDERLTPEIYSTFSTLIPVVGMLLSLMVFGERVSLLNFIGDLIVIVSIYIASRSERNKKDGFKSNLNLKKEEKGP